MAEVSEISHNYKHLRGTVTKYDVQIEMKLWLRVLCYYYYSALVMSLAHGVIFWDVCKFLTFWSIHLLDPSGLDNSGLRHYEKDSLCGWIVEQNEP